MKLYALLTFLLALPLFVRLLPESTEDSDKISPSSVAPAESPARSEDAAKSTKNPLPTTVEKPAGATVSSPAPAH